MRMIEFPYNRQLAVDYANRWAYDRNPAFYDFQGIGGNCTNFVSQCIFAGAGIMNYTPVFGWFYINANNRSASWTGVPYLHNFLTQNANVGPYGTDSTLAQMQPGDVIQMALNRNEYHHSMLVVKVGENPDPTNVLIAANTNDANCRPISTYNYRMIRFIHIQAVRTMIPDEEAAMLPSFGVKPEDMTLI